jgi:hypothetical protein
MTFVTSEATLDFYVCRMRRVALLLLASVSLFLLTCEKEEQEDFRICGTRCSSSAPWTVESFDLQNPCFSTQAECRSWADAHGYGDKPCIQCN